LAEGAGVPFTLDGQTFYSIQEACRLAGTNRDTFLRWVREKKYPDVENRDRNGWRLFTAEDLQRLSARVNVVQRVGAGIEEKR
jgi:DNA-binding transcriptional MerR regulator